MYTAYCGEERERIIVFIYMYNSINNK
jgi:hypothetical protein